MHTSFSSARRPSRPGLPVFRCALGAAVALAAASVLPVSLAGQEGGAPGIAGPPTAPPGFADPVNLYANSPYAPPRVDGEIHPAHLTGGVWLMAGEPGGSNVVVQLGDQGVLVIDTGTKEMAPKLLAQIRKLAEEHGGVHKEIRKIINTNGRPDHVGGNEVIAKAGSQIISGEERAQQAAFVNPGAEVVAHENVLRRMGADPAFRGMEPTDPQSFEVDNSRFNGEPVTSIHSAAATTDSQLMILLRASDVIVAGDVVDMVTYPVIDTKAGGTIDGTLVAINKVIAMAAPGPQAETGTIVVPGHGHLVDQSEVALYRNMVTIIRNTIQYYKNQGKTLQQVLDLKPTAGYDQRWGGPSGSSITRDFVTAVYETLPAKGPVFFQMKTTTIGPNGKQY